MLPVAPLCTLCGTVTHGKQLGRTLGFPTLNVSGSFDAAPPANGVYAALCWLLPEDSAGDATACANADGLARGPVAQTAADLRPYLAVLNQGRHPTFPEGTPTVEAHLLGFDGDAYGRRVALAYGNHLRPERRFPDGAALAAQLRLDCEAARRWAAEALPGVALAGDPPSAR